MRTNVYRMLLGSALVILVALNCAAAEHLSTVAQLAQAGPAVKPAEKPSPKPLGQLRVNFPVANFNMLPMHIASVRGFDKEEGFTAEFIRTPGTIGVQAMQAGDFHFSLSVGATTAAAIQGAPVRVVLVHFDKPFYYLYGKAGVENIQDLKGKSIAVDGIGSGLHVVVNRYLQRRGIDPKTINFIAMSNPAIPGAIIAGAVDAGVITTPADLVLKKSGKNRNLGFLGEEVPAVASGLGTTSKLMRERPEAVRAAVRASLKGQRFLSQNRQAAIPIMVKYLNVSEEDANLLYETFVPFFTKDGRISLEQQEQIVKDHIETLKPDRQPRLDEVFDFRFVEPIK